ncbi:MAG: hypothetical protein N4A33_00040 [Bacteriovoracaceae bacterium]|nr:hypothetical protein [Bacteriovoracaceae bacterium]
MIDQQGARSQALLNEYKGNLFEFLVAVDICRKFKIESSFIKSLPQDILIMLKQQENFIQNFYPSLVKKLPILASCLSKSLLDKLSIDFLDKVEIIGKSALASGNDDYAEADILLYSKEDIYPISIKLNKFKAQTNTKSAGVKSFLSKYFYDHEGQQELCVFVDQKFEEFARMAHEFYDVEYDLNFNNWVVSGLPTLPGQLEGRVRELYLKFLYEVKAKILSKIKKYSDLSLLIPLLGFSNANIIQATCFYKKDYQHAINSIHQVSDLVMSELSFLNKADSTYFEIQSSSFCLQIRIKAMNKFINKSFKVNCSVKYF